MIAIINYGMGNLNSVEKAFHRVNAHAEITSDHDTIRKADKLVLPGVGHFSSGMQKLIDSGLKELLHELVIEKKKPILGICLGMQLFTSFSEEGNVAGLNWIEGKTLHFGKIQHNGRVLPVPHMGWNNLDRKNDSTVLKDIPPEATFYFVHSYGVHCINPSYIIASSSYGKIFDSVICRDNIIGTQFHPEKSHKSGLKLIENFVNLF